MSLKYHEHGLNARRNGDPINLMRERFDKPTQI